NGGGAVDGHRLVIAANGKLGQQVQGPIATAEFGHAANFATIELVFGVELIEQLKAGANRNQSLGIGGGQVLADRKSFIKAEITIAGQQIHAIATATTQVHTTQGLGPGELIDSRANFDVSGNKSGKGDQLGILHSGNDIEKRPGQNGSTLRAERAGNAVFFQQ